jgi:hypothetical protein
MIYKAVAVAIILFTCLSWLVGFRHEQELTEIEESYQHKVDSIERLYEYQLDQALNEIDSLKFYK